MRPGQARRLPTGQAGKATGLSAASPSTAQVNLASGFPLLSLAEALRNQICILLIISRTHQNILRYFLGHKKLMATDRHLHRAIVFLYFQNLYFLAWSRPNLIEVLQKF
jgi:hypothetical protein